MSIARIKNNFCPICLKDNFYGHFDHNKSQIEIFSCRHFTCNLIFILFKFFNKFS